MHCEGCAERIGSLLNGIEGIRSAIADHKRGVVEIVHQDNKVSEGDTRDHLRDLGYAVEGHAEHGHIDDRPRERQVAS